KPCASRENQVRPNTIRSGFFGSRASAVQKRPTPNAFLHHQTSTIKHQNLVFVPAQSTARLNDGCRSDLPRSPQRLARNHRHNGFCSERRTTWQQESRSRLRLATIAWIG